MGSCCSKPTEKISEQDYRNKIKNDFASKLKELQKNHAQGASQIKETKNDGAQVSKTRQVTRSYNDSSSALKDDNMVIMTTAMAAGAGIQGGAYHGGYHGGGDYHGGGGCGGGGGHHGGGGCGGGGGGCGGHH